MCLRSGARPAAVVPAKSIWRGAECMPPCQRRAEGVRRASVCHGGSGGCSTEAFAAPFASHCRPVTRLVHQNCLPRLDLVLLRHQHLRRHVRVGVRDEGDALAAGRHEDITEHPKLLEVELEVFLRHVGRHARDEQAARHWLAHGASRSWSRRCLGCHRHHHLHQSLLHVGPCRCLVKGNAAAELDRVEGGHLLHLLRRLQHAVRVGGQREAAAREGL
mmetsp:Transcript_59502/g.153208  ORF Transcript_59502/g.153208 Transcript_59502/m.153208 type:complete len:218 (-) Transcript_59502:793-1446(-)